MKTTNKAFVHPTPAADFEQLESVVVEGTYPDLEVEWDEDHWILLEKAGRDPNWKTHFDCIRLAGGRFEWENQKNVNPTGRASFRWHIAGFS